MYHSSLLSLLLVISAYLVSGWPTSTSIVSPVDDALSTYYCSDSPTWSGPSFFPRDCATALAQFAVNEQLVHEDVVFEFLAVGGRAQSRYASQETPRKYRYRKFAVHVPQTYGQETPKCIPCNQVREMADLKCSLTGTCTMAIVMLVAFFPEDLPGVEPSRVFSLMDIASYNDVWNAVKQVMNNCISKYLGINETIAERKEGLTFTSQTGWSAFGTLHPLKTFGESIADRADAVQGAKVISASFYGTQVQA